MKENQFLNTTEAGTNTKNADYDKSILQDAVAKAREEFHCDVKAVVTDNAKS